MKICTHKERQEGESGCHVCISHFSLPMVPCASSPVTRVCAKNEAPEAWAGGRCLITVLRCQTLYSTLFLALNCFLLWFLHFSLKSHKCFSTTGIALCNRHNQEWEVQRLLQSWFQTRCIVFYNNISAGRTSLLQVYRCYWTYVAIQEPIKWSLHLH